MAGNSEWVSWAEAAQIIGCPVHVVEWWKRQGRIEHRAEDKRRPTLRRSSVEEFAAWYRPREKRSEQRRIQHAAEVLRRQELRTSADADELAWLTYEEAALLIGCDPSTVWRMVKTGKLVSRGRVGRARPSIARESVEAVAQDRRTQD